ncbi:MAG: hypothetical protein HOE73_02325 [Bacteroidetes Order II. Incertae sedis bacterium]|jgi:thiamine phosphate synthase YjbQ (UPF0047 family)|nr:hypothetical protein [Bacteroidetes Order II. bacterium]MDG1754991.1 hypothetical protein [Rhodothermales bacterium]MBT6580205.1 hypothetical protein [Bacteroidetes Order II. bacterium]MBT6597541.1 hypothetical protein [Bacteroidetes Order II. bacterium]MBT7401144.1 hypothetical protein [Bacteroidetes Order II. bacterium]
MAANPKDITLSIRPESRVDLIDVSERVTNEKEDFFEEYQKSVYASHHTTAGYFEQSFANRLKNDPGALEAYVGTFKKLFPPNADYRHDQMELRDELSDAQKLVEPKNADSHLTYIGSGLENCVTYLNDRKSPVYFIDLDGTNGKEHRSRKTTIVGYNSETVLQRQRMDIQMSNHPIDSINLWDERVGVLAQLEEKIKELGIEKGRIDLSLDPEEKNTGLTVNEYETLLMRHDLVEVLENPVRFMAQRGVNMLRDPGAIKEKAKDYMKYDLVHVVNEFIDSMGLSESLIERIIDKFFQVPAKRFLRMKRGVSLIVSDDETGKGRIVSGTYQSPILVQWRKAEDRLRHVNVTFTRFE